MKMVYNVVRYHYASRTHTMIEEHVGMTRAMELVEQNPNDEHGVCKLQTIVLNAAGEVEHQCKIS